MNFFETVRNLNTPGLQEASAHPHSVAAEKASDHADAADSAVKHDDFDSKVHAYAAHKKAANAHRQAMHSHRKYTPEHEHHSSMERHHSGQANLLHASFDEHLKG